MAQEKGTKVTEPTTKNNIRLPLWGWALVAGAGAVVMWRFYQARKEQAGGASGTAQDAGQPSQQQQYSLVPIPVATQTGNSPAEEQNYQTLLNSLNTLQGTVAEAPGTNCTLHVPYSVKKGDTLNSIGAQFGISGAHVQQANPSVHVSGNTYAQGTVISVPFNWCLKFPGLTSVPQSQNPFQPLPS